VFSRAVKTGNLNRGKPSKRRGTFAKTQISPVGPVLPRRPNIVIFQPHNLELSSKLFPVTGRHENLAMRPAAAGGGKTQAGGSESLMDLFGSRSANR
jgi:hypothetical protein